jgi:hypothetical protein
MHFRHYGGSGRLKIKLNSFTKIIQSILDRMSLASHIELQTLRNEHIVFAPDICSEIQFPGHNNTSNLKTMLSEASSECQTRIFIVARAFRER